jgi:hypothetical protein
MHPTRMSGVNDSLLIAVLLLLIFGAVSFYLYSRMSQTEKRLSLMENLLLQIKISTEASLDGPDSIEAISEAMPMREEDVESVDAEEYSEMLKEIPIPTEEGPIQRLEVEEEEEKKSVAPVEVNYEAMSLAELKAFAKQKGISGVQQKKKKEIIDLLKGNTQGELGGVDITDNGFPVEMSDS